MVQNTYKHPKALRKQLDSMKLPIGLNTRRLCTQSPCLLQIRACKTASPSPRVRSAVRHARLESRQWYLSRARRIAALKRRAVKRRRKWNCLKRESLRCPVHTPADSSSLRPPMQRAAVASRWHMFTAITPAMSSQHLPAQQVKAHAKSDRRPESYNPRRN